MSRELRTLVISLFLVFFLAGYNFLLYGTFFFTFPINDYLLLIVTAYYTWFHFKNAKTIWITALSYTLVNLFANEFNLEPVLTAEQLFAFREQQWPMILQWIAWALFALLFTLYYKKQQTPFRFVRMLVLFAPLAAAFLSGYYPLVHISPLFFVLELAFDRDREKQGLEPLFYQIILMNVLNLTKAMYLDF